MAVPVAPGPEWRAGEPKQLLGGNYYLRSPFRTYDVSPDGQRFLMIKPSDDREVLVPARMVLVENWFDELRRRLPPD